MKTIAYRGHLIRYNSLNGLWWIERDGSFLGYVKDEEDGRHQIDVLLD